MLHTLVVTVVVLLSAPQEQAQPPIRVYDAISGCHHSKVEKYEWTPVDAGFRRDNAFVTLAQVDELRKLILAASGEPQDLLAQIGFTPAALRAHRDDILAAAWPEAQRPEAGRLPEVPPEIERLLSWEALAPHVLAELKNENWTSTTNYRLKIEIPGDPPITIKSDGLVAWKLPWTIQAGGKSWQCSDIALSRALAQLVDPRGPNAELIDGTRYWSDEFWHDSRFWELFVGCELDAALSGQQYSQLDGYLLAMDRFRVVEAQSGSINLQPESLFLQIEARYPSTLDGAWWWNPLKEKQPTYTWKDFLAVYDAALASVERQAWLLEWKHAAAGRTLEVHAVGRTGFAERMRDKFVVPPWKDAGFVGDPGFEILLRRDEEWCGTVWLGSEEVGALIETAKPGPGGHWFDELEFSFHPKVPTYGRVDAVGHFELRTIAK